GGEVLAHADDPTLGREQVLVDVTWGQHGMPLTRTAPPPSCAGARTMSTAGGAPRVSGRWPRSRGIRRPGIGRVAGARGHRHAPASGYARRHARRSCFPAAPRRDGVVVVG